MSVENPNRLFEFSDEIMDDKMTFISNTPWKTSIKKLQDSLREHDKIPQRESQKIIHISQVLFTLYENKSMNTSQIKKESGLSVGSINRTMKLLREKRVVTMKQKKDKMNNEKIYKLKKNEAIAYHTKLWNWKRGHSKNIHEKYSKINKNEKFFSIFHKDWFLIRKQLPSGWRDWEIKIKKKNSNEFERINLSRNLYGPYIMLNYTMGKYCYSCFNEEFISKIEFDDDGKSVCRKCGREGEFVDEMPRFRMRKRGRVKFPVDDKISKIKRKDKNL